MFLDAIEERQKYLLGLLKEEEFQNKSLKVYQEMKEEMIKETKQKKKSKMESKTQKAEHLGKFRIFLFNDRG